jgi:hypothetical protein
MLVGGIVSSIHLFIFVPFTQVPFGNILVAPECFDNGLAIVTGDLCLCLAMIVIVAQHFTVLLGVNYKSHVLLLGSLVKGGRL